MRRCVCCGVHLRKDEGWRFAFTVRSIRLCDACFLRCYRVIEYGKGRWVHRGLGIVR